MLCAGEQGKDSCQGETLSLSIRLNDQTIELSSSRHKENFGIESNNKFDHLQRVVTLIHT